MKVVWSGRNNFDGKLGDYGTVYLMPPAAGDIEDFFGDILLHNPIYLDGMHVDQCHRGKGYGSALLEAAILKAKSRSIILQAYPYECTWHHESRHYKKAQKNLIDFYKRHGFKHVGGGWMYRRATP